MILEGDAESNYAHFALQKLRIMPSAFTSLSSEEKAFIIASIDIRIEQEKKEEERMRRKTER